METYQTTSSARTAKAKGQSAQSELSSLTDWHLIYSQDRHTLGVSATGNGLWQWHDLLAPPGQHKVFKSYFLAGLAAHHRIDRANNFR
jgi:hypothetical protein